MITRPVTIDGSLLPLAISIDASGNDPTPDVNDGNGNVIGGLMHGVINPLLAPLADNGGPTQTHALLPGSPAVNGGEPFAAAPPNFDQRGSPFPRVAGGRIDMGAFESQTLG